MSPPRPRTLTSIARVPGLRYGVLDELVGYQLRRAQVEMFLAFHQATRGQNITPPRFTALIIVGENPGLTQSMLGKALGIARSGAMLLVDRLEERGLVERRPRPNDGRSWGLHLTRAGEAFVASASARILRHDQKRSAKLTAPERRDLLRLLDKLAA